MGHVQRVLTVKTGRFSGTGDRYLPEGCSAMAGKRQPLSSEEHVLREGVKLTSPAGQPVRIRMWCNLNQIPSTTTGAAMSHYGQYSPGAANAGPRLHSKASARKAAG